MTTLQLSVPDEMRKFVEEEAAKGGYGSTEAYLRSLILYAQRQKEQEHLEEMLVAGIESGNPIVADEAYWERFEARLVERHGDRDDR